MQFAAAVVALASAVAMGTLLEIRAARRARMQTEPTALDPASQPAPTATPHAVRVTFAPVEDAHALGLRVGRSLKSMVPEAVLLACVS